MIVVRGRKKDVIVLKNGKNVYPDEIEELLAGLTYIKECVVFGELRDRDGDWKDPILSVRIVYDPEEAKKLFGTDDEKELQAFVKKDIDAICERLPKYKRIYRIYLTQEALVRTTTGKIKRNLISAPV